MALGLRSQYSSGETSISSVFTDPSLITYTSCYCEENIWKLIEGIQHRLPAAMADCYAVFISNSDKTIPLYRQKAAATEEAAVIWDYHVILVQSRDSGGLVYDLDTGLGWPERFLSYCTQTFRYPDEMIDLQYHRLLRVVPAKDFLHGFASDRHHMRREDGTWQQSPPLYPCIRSRTSTNNLQSFISMEPEVGIGDVMKLGDFVRRFATELDVRSGQRSLWSLTS